MARIEAHREQSEPVSSSKEASPIGSTLFLLGAGIITVAWSGFIVWLPLRLLSVL
jgi:hypothetical protein